VNYLVLGRIGENAGVVEVAAWSHLLALELLVHHYLARWVVHHHLWVLELVVKLCHLLLSCLLLAKLLLLECAHHIRIIFWTRLNCRPNNLATWSR